MKKCFYAGSFDPFTRGHADIVKQALRVFDTVVIGVGVNSRKTRLFSSEMAQDIISRACEDDPEIDEARVIVRGFEGSLRAAATDFGCSAIVRGLRQVSDFNDEFQLHGAMERLTDIPMTYFFCRQEFLHVSSSLAKELISLNEDVDWLLSPEVARVTKQAIACP